MLRRALVFLPWPGQVLTALALTALVLTGCSLVPPKSFPRAHDVNIDRFMGAWYVIAHIPPSQTKNAYNSIERYDQIEPGRIKTVFTYREGGFDGEPQTMEPTGYVIENTGNAVWGMQFVWPIKAQYVISYIGPDYDTAIIARAKRDYVWILARTPRIDRAAYDRLVQRVSAIGYDTRELRRVPQQSLAERHAS